MKTTYFFLLLIPLLSFSSWAQEPNGESLEKKRNAQLEKIEQMRNILKQQSGKKEASMAKLNAIQQQINQRHRLMLTLTSELNWLDRKMKETVQVVDALSADLEELKDEYAAMIYFSSKSGGAVEKLSYLFSSETVNQFVARMEYLKQYQKSRKLQISSIQRVKTTLTQRQAEYKKDEQEKLLLLDSISSNDIQLFNLQESLEKTVSALKKKETELKQTLSQQKAMLSALEKKISEQVKKQMVLSESGEMRIEETPAITKAASTFKETKGYMVWPVQEGFITSRFGKRPHPVLPNIWVENNGVDIRTKDGAEVRAVFSGIVRAVTKVYGMDWMVLIQHGNYFTAYSRLKTVKVELNESVNKLQPLGTVKANEEGVALVQFQIWYNQQKVNPEFWLSR